ncbi:fasciclin-like arabinogalactan protein 14 [Durio zibethinus]|uniref:Fasciclin-like arabinogalactan protein 14 n=1 Tax=Durio zibethinus TaxID=66656 RepID=A0A6P5WXJ2_DURZI|nr:fasciclin-like arabinogalactan protein 14 [Durio zibethinus]
MKDNIHKLPIHSSSGQSLHGSARSPRLVFKQEILFWLDQGGFLKMSVHDQVSPMSSPAVALFFSLFLLLLSAADAFNITEILSPYPDFTTFNNYLIQTGVAGEINSKQTITVLVVANGNMSVISGQSTDVIKKVLSVHVILDYFDEAKLENLHSRTLTVTTLYQQSGRAQNQQGFLNVSHVGNGPVAFGSAAPGSNLDSILVKTISTQPYNISVLQISNIINVASNSTTPSSPPAQTPAVSPRPPPAASPPRKALAPAPTQKESPAASPPNPTDDTAPSVDTTADGPGSDNQSSAVSVTCENYLASVLMVFTSAWFLLTMI